ncbi:GNAT family N-acetyltransferase [Sporosarcina gallistercoris]|uniref:GNAT family N-acetyltransferase n=1 Tax=Sporosarcina gallistercoris TaxID=2762245 RepID=UPI003D28C839
MKQASIQYREIKREDYPALEKIICDTWEYEKYSSPQVAKQMAKYFLASSLANQTFTCVAENNGVAVGVIMAKVDENFHTPIRFATQELLAAGNLKRTEEGRHVATLLESIDRLNKRLLKQSGMQFDGELALFIVGSDQRGNGIGGELYNRFLKYTQAAGIESYYLFTDSDCNVGFYEHKGLKRMDEETHNLKPYVDEDMSFYLYGHDASAKTKKLA